jgi:methylated-DNA-[protein]-cysteine S-methyltransferase
MEKRTMNKKGFKTPEIHRVYYESPIGTIEIVGTESGVTSLAFAKPKSTRLTPVPHCLKEVLEELEEYFQGRRQEFGQKLILQGTDFQKQVWRELLRIPYGRTISYKDVAAAIGRGRAVRAVGNANRVNNIAIIIPCHRVIGSNGKLVGYGGGLWRKKWLLEHEQRFSEDKKKSK